MSRTALNGLVLGDIEKDFMLDLIRRYAKLYLVEILGYCLMGKHFHLIDLNPVRAGLVDRPEEYRWNSLGYHIQTGNKDNFLSLDFGLQEFGIMDAKERLRGYRRYVYEAGAVDRSEFGQRKVIGEMVVEKEQKKEFKINKVERFRYRTRYFTDSGIIGTKEFVATNYHRFKDIFMSKREKIPKSIAGLDGIYSLKRLVE